MNRPQIEGGRHTEKRTGIDWGKRQPSDPAVGGVTIYRVELRFLYIGSDDTERDLTVWLALPGATLRWRFQAFAADVAAVDLGAPPLVLVADHRPAGSVLPIYAVADLEGATAELTATGWSHELGPMGTPEGPATVLRDGSGTLIALLQVDRPGAMDGAYADQSNERAVR